MQQVRLNLRADEIVLWEYKGGARLGPHPGFLPDIDGYCGPAMAKQARIVASQRVEELRGMLVPHQWCE